MMPRRDRFGSGFLQHLESLAQNLAARIARESGDIAAGTRQAGDKAGGVRIDNAVMTIGMVAVAVMAATVDGLDPAKMMSTPNRTSSTASAGSRSMSPLAKRYSMVTFSPTR